MKKFVLVLLSIAVASAAVMANPLTALSISGAEMLETDGIPFDPNPVVPDRLEPHGSFDCINIELRGDSWSGYSFWIDCRDGAGMSRIELENLRTGEKQNIRVRYMGPVTVHVNQVSGPWKISVKDLEGVIYEGCFYVDESYPLSYSIYRF